MKKLIIFDMDGVLIDSFYPWLKTVDETARYFGFPKVSEKKFRKLFGQSTEKDMELLMPGTSVEEIEKHYTKIFPKYISNTKLMPNAKKLLDGLKQMNVNMAIATNTNHRIAEKQLDLVGIKSYFTSIVGGDEVEKAKPSPDLLLKTLEKNRISNKEAIYVGDTIYDLEAGKSANIFTIGYKIKADEKVDDLIDILKVLKHAR